VPCVHASRASAVTGGGSTCKEARIRSAIVSPRLALLEPSEPRLEETPATRVAVAPAAGDDPEPREHRLEAPGGEGGAIFRAEDEPAGDGAVGSRRSVISAIDSSARKRSSSKKGVISRVQQWIAAIKVGPPVLGDPDRGLSACQSWSGRSTRKKPGQRSPRLSLAALDQPLLAHHSHHSHHAREEREALRNQAA
jgi:hypothetical protein